MNLKLTGKTALITGSTSGIGFETAKILLEEGAVVYLNGRKKSSVNEAVAKLKVLYPQAEINGFIVDFKNPEELNQQLQSIEKIDILINNVGIYTSKSFFETSADEWQQQFEVNVMSGVALAKYFLPGMLQRNWGRILFISSECTYLVPTDMISYSATKAMLHAISRGLAQLTKSTEVTVNTVVPGSTLTEGAALFLEEKAKAQQQDLKRTEHSFFESDRPHSLLQRFASVREVGQTIVYLCSPLSSATNGSVIKIDGGSSGGIL